MSAALAAAVLGTVPARASFRNLKEAHLAVTVRDGVATLQGRAPDITARAIASRVTRAVVGARAVDNRLWADDLRLHSG